MPEFPYRAGYFFLPPDRLSTRHERRNQHKTSRNDNMAPDRGTTTTKTSLKAPQRAWDALTPALSEWILDATASMNFTKPTPVQASTIPLFLAHKDVVVEAVTGSGKTLSFLIPLVERLLRSERTKKHHVAAIVISPTRELATQIHNVLLSLLAFHGPSAAAIHTLNRIQDPEAVLEEDQETAPTIYPAATPTVIPQLLLGGSTTAAQDLSKFLRTSPNVLISTPGRLLEILSSPHVHCPQSFFDLLVLDEADRLLDLGFKDTLTRILSLLPKQRRTGLFSASVSEAVDQIIRVGLRNPVRIAVKVRGADGVQDKRTPASLKMTYTVAPASQKLLILGQILEKLEPTPLRTIVYVSTCAAVDYFQHLLPAVIPPSFSLVPLHGKHPSNVRAKNFDRFTNTANPAVLLTTDVAARGLDVPNVDLVIQLDPPTDPKVFIHRCGRAGRAGRRGLSVVMLTSGREEEYVDFLTVRKTPIVPLDGLPLDLSKPATTQLTQKLRAIVMSDRSIHDKSQKAFVSAVRAYSKHQARSIFPMQDLDWGALADGWALLRFPKMPEAKSFDRTTLSLPVIDWDTFAYKDKPREKQRQIALASPEATMVTVQDSIKDQKRQLPNSWSEKAERKVTREVKRTKREAKRMHESVQLMSQEQKEHDAETRRMIEAVRRQQLKASRELDADFEGFDS